MPTVGSKAPAFTLSTNRFSDITLEYFKGRKLVLNIFLSVDTDVCPLAVRRFSADLGAREDVAVLCVSMDLPFAISRFLEREGIENLEAASVFRSPKFGRDYGVLMIDGPLAGLFARAVVVIDEAGSVVLSELVTEINDEPNYDAVLAVLS